ncbi:unnamed protein product [Boreogadus saida]
MSLVRCTPRTLVQSIVSADTRALRADPELLARPVLRFPPPWLGMAFKTAPVCLWRHDNPESRPTFGLRLCSRVRV